jgi:hypothetical protein
MRARRLLPCLVVLGGCNQLFGLDAPADDDGGDDGDAATTDGRATDDDGQTIDAQDIGIDARVGTPGVLWAIDLDYMTGSGRVRGYEAGATFGVTENCSRLAVSGTCFAERCTSVVPQTPAPNSGKITTEGNLRLLDLMPDANGVYTPLWGMDGGFFDDAITCGTYSVGNTVPAFNGTLVSPNLVTLSGQALPSPSTPSLIVRSGGFSMQWAPTTGTVYLLISDNGGGHVHCDFPASAGSAFVTPTVLTELLAGPGTLSSFTVARLQIPAGSYDIQWNLARAARRSDGALARGTVTLQ